MSVVHRSKALLLVTNSSIIFPLGKTKKGNPRAVPPSRLNQIPKALLNENILQLIFEHFDLQPGSPTTAQTRKNLLPAAKACKAFSQPALSSLWRILPSLLPLLLLLPSAEISDNQYVSPRPLLYLSRRLTDYKKFVDRLPLSSNWGRFDIHAPRVRTLYMEPLHVVISPHVYLRIRSLRHHDTPLLPGLKEIFIPNQSRLDFSSALLLASGSSLSLVQLNNSATLDRQFYIPFLFLLSINSPNLTRLTLSGIGDTSLELIPCFKRLRSLELRLPCTYIGSQVLQDLGKLDNLLQMTLDTGSPSLQTSTTRPLTKQSDLTPPSTNPTFIKLRKLHILGTLSSMSHVLDKMNVLTNLTTFIIHEIDRGSGHDTWDRCFAIVSTFPAIEDIEIIQQGSSLSTLCFYPLYKLNNVTSFVIKNSTLSGSNQNFRFLSCFFPKLRRFVEPYAKHREGRTLASLFHFSQANRDLRELKISLAYDISKNFHAINVLGRPIIQNHQHPLERLYIASNFGSLDLPDTIRVAQFLDLIFPNLSTLEACSSDTCEASNWTKIQQIRVALQAARIQASSASNQ